MHCTKRMWKKPALKKKKKNEDAEDAVEQEDPSATELQWLPCNKKNFWRCENSLQSYLPSNMTPVKFLKGLYWFLEPTSVTSVLKHSGLASKTYCALSFMLRCLMLDDIESLQASLPLMGGRPDRAVCVDETYFTKPKTSRSGFRGAPTIGTQTIVLGMCEIDLNTRKCTGNIRLIIIPSPSKEVFRAEIRKHVLHGSLIFTDSLNAYHFLTAAGYVHRAINHRRKEFSRTEVIFGREVIVSTNSVEGLFGRLKTFVRQRNLKKFCKHNYGLILAQYLWEQHYASNRTQWHKAPLWPLLEMIQRHQDMWGMIPIWG